MRNLFIRKPGLRSLLIAATLACGLLSAMPATAQIRSHGITEHCLTDFSSKKRFKSSYKQRRYGKRGWRQRHVRTTHRYRPRHGYRRHGGSVSMAGVVAPLAAKAQQIVAACGSRVVSAVRRGARISSGHYSNHAAGRAVDIQGNPSCIYSMLRGWPGGVSTDYASAPGGPHVHVSYSPHGMEWGLKFSHGRRAYAFMGKKRGKTRRYRYL